MLRTIIYKLVLLSIYLGLGACAVQRDAVLSENRAETAGQKQAINKRIDEVKNEFIQFNKELEYHINDKGFSGLFSKFDTEAMAQRIHQKVGSDFSTASSSQKVVSTILEKMQGKLDEAWANSKSWKFVKLLDVSEDGTHSKSLIRFFGTGGLSYFYLFLQKKDAGIVVRDLHLFSVNMPLEDIIVTAFTIPQQMETISKYSVVQESSKSNDIAKYYRSLTLYRNAIENLDFQEAVYHFENLPVALRSNPLLLSGMIEAGKTISAEDYYQALTLWERYSRDKSRVSEYFLDYYTLNQNYEAARKLLDTWLKDVGEEAGIYCMYANIYLAQKNYELAKMNAEKALRMDADYQDTYNVLYSLSLQQKQWGNIIIILDIMKNRFSHHYDRDLFEKDPDLTEFVKSAEYQEWAKQLDNLSPEEQMPNPFVTALNEIQCQKEGSVENDKMISLLKDNLKESPYTRRLWHSLSQRYHKNRCYDAAAKALEQVIKLSKEISPDLLLKYAVILSEDDLNKIEGKPLELILEALKLDPNHKVGLTLLSAHYVSKNDFPTAKKLLRALRKKAREEGMPVLGINTVISELEQLESRSKHQSETDTLYKLK